MRKITLQIITIVSCLLLGSAVGTACICENPNTPSQEFESVAAVFSGKAVKMTAIKTEQGLIEGYLVKFFVEKSWKLINQKEVVIFTTDVGMCGYPFDIGETYLVYASRKDGLELTTGICRKTSKPKYAKEELKDLGKRALLKISKGKQ